MRRTMAVSRKKGFTLIELLVVISVIALLLSILMPSLRKVQRHAKTVVCQSRLKQWGMIFVMYADDYDGYLLEGWYEGCDNSGVWPFVVWPWREDNPKLSYCPMAKKPIDSGGRVPFAAWGTQDSRFYGSYGINSWALNPPGDIVSTEGHLTRNNWRRVDVKGASKVPLLLDSQWVDGWPEDIDEPLSVEDQNWRDCGDATLSNMRRFSVNRHDENVNTLLLDSSIKKTGIKELWKLKWHRSYNTNGVWTLNGGVQPNSWPEWMAGFKEF